MPYIYILLVGLAMIFPEIGHEAGPTLVSGVLVSENAVIYGSALTARIGVEKKAAEKAAEVKGPEIMKKIAKCESNDRHFESDGEVLIGKYDPRDIGRYQINKSYWEDEAKQLGYDIYSEAGNEAFARYLYRKYGTEPWKQSQSCWSRL